MKRSPWALLATALVLAAGAVGGPHPAVASARSQPLERSTPFDGLAYRRQHGYLPLRGVATLLAAKAHAAAEVAAQHGQLAPAGPRAGGPGIGASWEGSSGGPPPDANGAVGPKSYIEITNNSISIYKRDGSSIASATLFALTGHAVIGDPMVMWDPDTQRFYYSMIGLSGVTMSWGFSKGSNPTTIPGSFCTYDAGFGLPTGLADYPKLGQTKGFLMIGMNFYPPGSEGATEGDLLWISKPQGSGEIKNCPDVSTFKTGAFHDLRNQDGTQGFTPVPAIQTDPSKSGYVTAMSDIECPPTCGAGTLLTTYTLKPSKQDPTVPSLSAPVTLTVGRYKNPPDAPQKGTTLLLDTLDGRLTHAVSGFDPRVGKTTVWVTHCVLGGAGAEQRWYEIIPGKNASLLQSDAGTDPDLYVYNGAVSNDRTVNASGVAAHGSTMVLGFNTSSAVAYVAVQMVSKVGSKAQSGFVLVKQSKAPFAPTSCGSLGCRWGDYSGATPDPAAKITDHRGKVWFTNEWTEGDSLRPTWNWEAIP